MLRSDAPFVVLIDIGKGVGNAHAKIGDVVGALEIPGEDPALAGAATRRKVESRDESDGGLVRGRDFRDGADEVKFKLRFVLGIEVGG